MPLTVVEFDMGSAGNGEMIVPLGVVEVGASRYVFYIDGSSSNDLCYRKSTNRGRTWGSKVTIHAATYEWLSIWFDKWTPGDSGTKIHIAAVDSGADDVNYFSLDTASDTLGNGGTAIVIFNGASTASTGGEVTISKARGGNLGCAFDIDGGTETGFYRSTDGGATWGSRANPNEATSDYYILFPGNEADNQDMWLVYWDRSANEISLKVYDDSADSWAETSIDTSMFDVSVATTGNGQFCGAIRPSDNHLLLAAWSERDTATADLKTWDINGAASITAKTNVHTDIDDCTTVVLSFDPNARVYCSYIGKGDGSETLGSSVNIYQKFSDDGMATWSGERPVYDDQGRDCFSLTGPMLTESGRPFISWLLADYVSLTDGLFGAYQVSSARSQSHIGV